MAQEKTITINLVKAFGKPKTKRAKSALHFLKNAVTKETRIKNIKISNGVNEAVWSRGLFNCPRKITVKIIIEKENARVYLPDEKIEDKKTDKKEIKTDKTAATAKKEETKTEEKTKHTAETKEAKPAAQKHETTHEKTEHKTKKVETEKAEKSSEEKKE